MNRPHARSLQHPSLRRTQRGFTMVAAIFILVVLVALGGFIVSISTQQQIGSAQDVQGVRAYQAARAGLEWGLYRQLRAGSCVATSTFVPPASSLSGLTVTVTCTSTPDATSGPSTTTLTSVACNQPSAGVCPNNSPGANYIERRVDVSF